MAGFTQREARHIVRKAVARVPEGEEIRHLNIMPMMDMMTILLVAFIFQISTSSLDIIAQTVQLPRTDTDEPVPEKVSTLVIGTQGIVVEGAPIAAVTNGDVDASVKEGGVYGYKITPLTSFLAKLRGLEIEHLKSIGVDPASQPPPELLILADRTTPYRLLVEVMFSAKVKEAGYKDFRLIVQKNQPVHPTGQ
jgi:biopolymer transport protein ExbD